MSIYIAYYHGKNESLENLTGYIHNEKTEDSIETIVKKVLDAGLNIEILHNGRKDLNDYIRKHNLNRPLNTIV